MELKIATTGQAQGILAFLFGRFIFKGHVFRSIYWIPHKIFLHFAFNTKIEFIGDITHRYPYRLQPVYMMLEIRKAKPEDFDLF